jgi:pimeloyl-ACP methyl ester carboxylesterase
MIEYQPIQRPGFLKSLNELKTVFEITKSATASFFMQYHQAQISRKIILLPGFGMGENSMKLLQNRLNQSGHQAIAWGLGRNHGKVTPLLSHFEQRLIQAYEKDKKKVDLIGWSLGGYIAREAARNKPETVRQVITLAGPAIGGPKYTLCGTFYEQSGWDLDQIESTVKQRYETPIQVPIISIYTQSDGIISWEACLDKWSPNVRHIEVFSTHMGMPFSMEVFQCIMENL